MAKSIRKISVACSREMQSSLATTPVKALTLFFGATVRSLTQPSVAGKWVGVSLAPIGCGVAILAMGWFSDAIAIAAQRRSRLSPSLTFALPPATNEAAAFSGAQRGGVLAAKGAMVTRLSATIVSGSVIPVAEQIEPGIALDLAAARSNWWSAPARFDGRTLIESKSELGSGWSSNGMFATLQDLAQQPGRLEVAFDQNSSVPSWAANPAQTSGDLQLTTIKAQQQEGPLPPGSPVLPMNSPAIARTDRGIEAVERSREERVQKLPWRRRIRPDGKGGERIEFLEDRPIVAPPLGITLGSFRLFPVFEVVLTAQSNPLRMPEGGKADVAAELAAKTELRSDWSRHALALNASVENKAFVRLPSENATQWSLGGDAAIEIQDQSSITFTSSHGHFVVPRGSAGEFLATREPIQFDRSGVAADLSFVGVHSGVKFSAGLSRSDYQDAQTAAGAVISQQFRDVTRKNLAGTVELLGKPGSAISLSFRREWFDYRVDQSADRDGRLTSVILGWRGDITPLVHGSMSAGFFRLEFKNSAVPTRTSPTINAELAWAVTPLTTARLSASREVDSTSDPRGLAQVRTTGTVSVNHSLLRELLLGLKVMHQITDFEGIAGQDQRWREQMSARWALNRNLSAKLVLEAEQRRNSSRVGSNYDNYSLQLGFAHAF